MTENQPQESEGSSEEQDFRSGYVSIIGAPNVGKSTLLNTILGQKLAIVTPKPQTTRNQIRGIVTTDTHQMIFVDTPGLMDPKYLLQSEMVRTAYGAMRDADVILLVVDVSQQNEAIETEIIKEIKRLKRAKKILVLNKVDLVDKRTLLPLIEGFNEKSLFDEIVPISAKTGDGVPSLLEQVAPFLPFGPLYYPEDQLSDLPERFFISETVREKLLLITKREVPYSCAVVVEEFEKRQRRNSDEILYIRAIIYAEKQTQKQIIIGKGGNIVKQVGELARLDIEKFLETPVYLELYVTVKTNWRRDTQKLKELGGFLE